MDNALSMAAFALASSISPGPVNIVALSAGARHGLGPSMRHVTGATVGFTLLLLLTGFGLQEILVRWPGFTTAIRWAGVLFLLYMAFKLATDDGHLQAGSEVRGPSLLFGATMQWLNPKAWLAAVAGMGAYAAGGDAGLVWRFSALYFLVCYLSIACWALAGMFLRQALQHPGRVRWFNRALAVLLVASAAYMMDA
jgi:threonine/homoserine/homoserine lactone efflux protein